MTQTGRVQRSAVVADAPLCRVTDGGHGSLALFVRGNGSAFRLAAFCLTGGPPGYGGDRRVGLVERLRCSGGWIMALGGQCQAMHERPGRNMLRPALDCDGPNSQANRAGLASLLKA